LDKGKPMNPSHKSEQVDNDITTIFGVDRRANIKGDLCTSCGQAAITFRDGLSRLEYTISGLCQACQDIIFVEPEDEDEEYDL
jgi:hypothetical protein